VALTTNATIADLVVGRALMSADVVARVNAPERLSGIVPVTGAIPVVVGKVVE
jgi:aspartate ammonia-lyase